MHAICICVEPNYKPILIIFIFFFLRQHGLTGYSKQSLVADFEIEICASASNYCKNFEKVSGNPLCKNLKNTIWIGFNLMSQAGHIYVFPKQG